jgi:hypothetical protein
MSSTESIPEDFAEASTENLVASNVEGDTATDDEQNGEGEQEAKEVPIPEAEDAGADTLGDTGGSDDFIDDGDDLDMIVSS